MKLSPRFALGTLVVTGGAFLTVAAVAALVSGRGRAAGGDCRRGGGDGGGSNPWSSSIPDFSITT